MIRAPILSLAVQGPVVTEPVAVGLGVGWPEILRAAVMVLVGLPLLMALSRWARRVFGRRSTAQHGLIAGKVVFYPGIMILMITVLGELGFGLTPILGAAGVVGIALGFASQTSVSNVISGLFLIAERPFEVDDLIQVGTTTGRVISIDTLSIKLRTFDNRFVRIPNETIVKSEVTTITRFPIRRLDLNVGIAYREDVARVRALLLEIAGSEPMALMEPAPVVFIDGFGESSVNLRLGVWVVQAKYLNLKISLQEAIKARFDREGVQIPFPQRTLTLISDADPLGLQRSPEEEDSPDTAAHPDSPSNPEVSGEQHR